MTSEVAPVAGHQRNTRPWAFDNHKGITSPRYGGYKPKFPRPFAPAPDDLFPVRVEHPDLTQPDLRYGEYALLAGSDVYDESERIIAVDTAHGVDGEQVFLGVGGAWHQRQRDEEMVRCNSE